MFRTVTGFPFLALLLALVTVAPSGATVIYDSGGFQGFALGSLVTNPQDGWFGYALASGLAPEIVSVSGDRKIKLAKSCSRWVIKMAGIADRNARNQ